GPSFSGASGLISSFSFATSLILLAINISSRPLPSGHATFRVPLPYGELTTPLGTATPTLWSPTTRPPPHPRPIRHRTTPSPPRHRPSRDRTTPWARRLKPTCPH